MKKVIGQFAVSVLIFGVVLFGFSRVDWLDVFHLHHTVIEEKLGKMYWDLFSRTEKFMESDSIQQPLDSLLTQLCEANQIDRNKIKLHVIESAEVNAFAFPDNHLVVYSSLIHECKNEMELCGVMAHEMAHIEKGHVMKKLIKEVGLSVLVGMASGNGGGEIISETAKLLSSTAYDRTLESEADDTAVKYLLKAKINPMPFGDFLHRLSEEEDLPAFTEWISTHPDSEKRSLLIYDRAKETENSVKYQQILNITTWENLQSAAVSRELD